MFKRPKMPKIRKGLWFLLFVVLLTFFGVVSITVFPAFRTRLLSLGIYQISKITNAEKKVAQKPQLTSGLLQNQTKKSQSEKKATNGSVLAVQDEITDNSLVFRLPVFFAELIHGVSAKFDEQLEVGTDVTVGNDLTVEGDALIVGNLTLGDVLITPESIEAPNVVYTIMAGTGISISGDQDVTITNSDTGSAQNIFKNVKVGSNTISASSNTDTLTLEAGSGITLSNSDKTITISADSSDLNVSGWYDDGTAVRLVTSTDNVGIGTDTPGYKLHVVGDSYFSGTATFAGGAVVSSGINNSSGGITNSGAITGATGLTSSGTITFSSLSTGILHANVNGVVSSSAVNLAGSDVSGTLPVNAGGTGLTSFNTGDILYASAANTLAALGAGAEGEVLTISSGIPAWGSSGAGTPCATCIVDNPGSTQTITPTAATAVGLVIKQASSGSVDVFRVESNDGADTYFKIDSSGNVTLGNQTSSGVFTVSPDSTDPISISPVAQGAGQFTGTITSADLTGNVTWTFPDSSGVVCLASGNCSGTSAGVGGSGTMGYISKWTSTYGLTDSVLYDNGTNIGLGTTNPTSKLHVVGTTFLNGNTTLGADLSVAGHATISGSLRTDQAVDFNDTLGVSGATTLGSTLDVTGLATFGSNVGIGTTDPGAQLEIESTTTNKVILDAVSDLSASRILFNQGSTNLAYVGTGTGSSDDDLILNGSDDVRFDSGGSTRMTLTSEGNLGIGTTTNSVARVRIIPDANSSGIAIASYSLTGSNSSNLLDLSGTWNTSGTPKGIYLNITNTASNSNSRLLQLQESSNTRFAVYPTGNTDILVDSSSTSNSGMSSPGLVILNTNTTTNNFSSIKFGDSNSDTAGGISLKHTDHTNNYGDLYFITRDSIGIDVRMSILSAGNVGIGTTAPIGKLNISGAATGKALTIINETGDQAIFVASASGTNRFIIQNDGNVGIGSSAPAAILDVVGNSQITGELNLTDAIRVSGDAGTSGYLLTSSGGGAMTWTDPSSLAGANYWRLNLGTISPYNDTLDLLVGANSTASAKFAFMNVNSGTPTASISGNLAIAVPTGANPATTYNVLNGGTFNLQSSPGGNAGLTSRFYVNSTGNIGIGTTTTSVGKVNLLSGNEYGYTQTNGTVTLATYVAPTYAKLTTTSNHALRLGFNGTAEALAIDTTGYIGFMDTSPDANLEISGSGTSGATMFMISSASANDGDLLAFTRTGNLGIGSTAPAYALDVVDDFAGYAASIFNNGDATTRSGLLIQAGLDDQTAAGPSTLVQFNDGDGGAVGSITFGSSVTNYNTSSDIRLKNDFGTTNKGLSDLMKIQVHDYAFKEDSSQKTHTGFMAQELYQVYPEAVTAYFNSNKSWQVDYGKLTPLLVRSVQEQQELLTSLQVKLDAKGEIVQIATSAIEESHTQTTQQSAEIPTLETLVNKYATITQGVWKFIVETRFAAQVTFESTVNYLESVVFKKDVIVEGTLTLNENQAGVIIIPAGKKGVRVQFSKEFSQSPIVTVTAAQKIFGEYWVTQVSGVEFSIELETAQAEAVQVNWQAVLVEQKGGITTQVIEFGVSEDSGAASTTDQEGSVAGEVDDLQSQSENAASQEAQQAIPSAIEP